MPHARLACLLAAGLVAAPAAAAQDRFEGVIVARMYADGKPMELSTTFKGTKSRMELKSGPGAGQGYQLIDGASGSLTMVMPSQRMYMVFDTDAMARQATDQAASRTDDMPRITETGETETIAGHACAHYLIETDDGQLDICAAKGLGFMGAPASNPMARGRGPATPSIPLKHRALYEKFKDGFQPLKMERLKDGKRELMMEVVSIEKRSVEESQFQVPEGFRKVDMPGMMNDAMRGRPPRPPA